MKSREILVTLFQTCNGNKSLSQLHSHSLKTGFIRNSFFATKLITLYGKFSHLIHARKLFDETPQKTVFLYNAILRTNCVEKQWKETLTLFQSMNFGSLNDDGDGDIRPDNYTISIVLKACAGLREIQMGKTIHGYVKKMKFIASDLFVGSALIELYSKCGEVDDGLKVFNEFLDPDVVLWTSMVTMYEQNGYPEEAYSFFLKMVMIKGLVPGRVTLVSVVSACAQLLNFKGGSSVHGFMMKRSFDMDLTLVNSLLNLYAKTGSVKNAVNLFRTMQRKDVISWSCMIGCYVQSGAAREALCVFHEMIDKKLVPNYVTVVSALQACAAACNLKEGKKIHELATRKGFDLDVSVSTALVDMYMKCSAPNEALKVFQEMPNKDVVAWAALLSGYAKNGMTYKSMEVFCNMVSIGIKPDAVAMVKVLAACSIFPQVLCLHGYITKSGFDSNAFVGASLIELYSKCGNLENARGIFDGLMEKDVVIWSSMIAAYGVHGQGEEALRIFNSMIKKQVVKPNNITFLSVLSACSHAGLVEEGIKIFNIMVNEYQMKPKAEHYGITVDLLGRTGDLNKAIEIIDRMPIPVGPHVWGALLGACRNHQNDEIGEIAAHNLFKVEPNHAGYYILLSNIYAADGKWENVEQVRCLMKEKRLKKMFGQSAVEV